MMGHTLILTISFLKVGGCIGTAKPIYNVLGTAWQKVLKTTYFSFDEVSLKCDVKLAVIIF